MHRQTTKGEDLDKSQAPLPASCCLQALLSLYLLPGTLLSSFPNSPDPAGSSCRTWCMWHLLQEAFLDSPALSQSGTDISNGLLIYLFI